MASSSMSEFSGSRASGSRGGGRERGDDDDDALVRRFSYLLEFFCARRGWRDERPGRTKSTKAISRAGAMADFAPTLNEIRC